MLIIHNASTQATQPENQKSEDFKDRIDSILKEFKNKINKKLFSSPRTNVGRNFRSINYFGFSIPNKHYTSVSLSSSDWKSIESSVYWKIQTFYNFHNTFSSAIGAVKNQLRQWSGDARITRFMADTLLSISQSIYKTFPTVGLTTLVGASVSYVLTLIEQNEAKFKYSKQNILDIYSIVLEVAKEKDINRLRNAIAFAQKALYEIKLEFKNLFSLPISRSKINRLLADVDNIILLAEQRKRDADRWSNWGRTWY